MTQKLKELSILFYCARLSAKNENFIIENHDETNKFHAINDGAGSALNCKDRREEKKFSVQHSRAHEISREGSAQQPITKLLFFPFHSSSLCGICISCCLFVSFTSAVSIIIKSLISLCRFPFKTNSPGCVLIENV